jgi:hypothetical protein
VPHVALTAGHTAEILASTLRPNGIVEADELACQYEATGRNSYRSSVVKVLDGLAA